MRKRIQNNDDYESDDYEETDTLISRSKSASRIRTAPRKNTKKSSRRPGSPNKARPNSALAGKTGHDLWMTALKKRQGALGSGSPRHKTPIEYWVDTLRKTGTGISTESSGRNTFTGLKKNNDLNMAYHSTSHHLRQMMGVEKAKKYPDATSRSGAGTPAYKTQEEYYDEVLELRKQIGNLSQDNSTMKAKVRRLEEDKIKKDKELEGLLNPAKSEELRRTMGDRKADSGAVIHSLKQKILKLEMQLREKDASHAKLQGDLKVTKIDEMKCQMEVLYQEITRLQNSKETGIPKSARSVSGKDNIKVKALNETIIRLSKNNEQLQAENRSLKEELENDNNGVDGHVSSRDYEDMNRKQLLSTLKKMNLKMEKLERKIEGDNLSIMSIEKNRANVPGKIDLSGSIENRLQQLDHRETELLDELSKQKNLVQKLKEERLFYKQQCEESKSPGRMTKASPRRPNTRGSDVSRPPTGRRRSGQDEEDRIREEKLENLKQRAAANSIQRNWRRHKSEKEIDEEKRRQEKLKIIRENIAAKHIQRGWKEHQQEQYKRQARRVHDFTENRAARKIQHEWTDYKHRRDDRELDDASYLIQGALNGHHARKQRLSGYQTEDSTEDESLDNATQLIQSSIRGHMGRKQKLKTLRYDSTDEEDYRRPSSAMRNRNISGGRRPSRSPRTSYYSGHSRGSHNDEDDDDDF
ncbi:IQ domain-containing protein E isoform X2 [Patella vulgata]|uniref:IQ domain-containing protein E isoform X2 n=1 Tax=Patella vulgata TaxID=6465 RepID=UPI0024A7C842|nr:IQ domain-containing protein E isoform X2 [Patella vulgata]